MLHSQILADIAHAQWVFSIPKMLRPYFLHHRELLGEIARIAYDTVLEMMAAAVDEPGARPGMVGVIQTFASSLEWNPHIHSITSRGVWTPDGAWMPVPYVDEHRAELHLPAQDTRPAPRLGAHFTGPYRLAPLVETFRV